MVYKIGTNLSEQLTGSSFADTMNGMSGNDRIFGLGGNDKLWGANGADSIFGGDGNDYLNGGHQNDMLNGGNGADELEGSYGNDVLTGGAEADFFEFERGDGYDVITDFQNGVDRIELDDFSAQHVRLAVSAAQQVGDHLVLTLTSDTVIVFKDMDKAQLDMNDFLL